MKNLSQRELRLAMATGIVVVCGITFMVVQTQLLQLKELVERDEDAQLAKLRQENLIGKRPDLMRELQVIRGQLPRHAEGQDLKPQFSRQVQSLAGSSGLKITGLTPEPEETLPELELYRSAVTCNWSGKPEELIDFLVRLQQLGPIADVRDLRIRNRASRGEGVSGTFTLEFVYARVPETDLQPERNSSPNKAENGDPS